MTARCYLRNRSSVNFTALSEIVNELNARVADEPLPKGFIETLYAPKDESEITKDDRVFYTTTNARRLDNYRRMIDETPSDFRDLLLGPLLSTASVHSNTAGVFKGFYKDRTTGSRSVRWDRIGCSKTNQRQNQNRNACVEQV